MRTLRTYYYEGPDLDDCGVFLAESDEEAQLRAVLARCEMVYREDETTEDGRPFVIVYQDEGRWSR